MSDSRFKVYDRVLSVILVLFIIAGVVPVSANAGTDDPEELHNYTFTVKDSNGEGVKGAVITYTAFFNQEIYVQNKTAETDGTGKVVLKELSGLNEEKLENSKLVIHYSVKADGYSEIEDAVSDITNAYENIDVIIHKIEAEKISVNLTKSGNGTVSLNEESLNNTLEMPKDQNKELTIQFRADEKYYIKTLSVNGAEKISTNDFPTEYSLKTTAEKDIDISVVFAETYTVRIQQNTESGKITLGSSEHNNVSEYTETFTEAKTEKFSYQAADGYKISLVKINNKEQELKDGSEFSTELAVNQDIDIELKVVKIYKVNVKLDPAKAVLETDPELETVTSEGGSVTVESGSNFGIKVIPAEGFRISEFKINNTEPKIDYSQLANGEEYSTNLKVTKDTDIVVTFVRIEYDITAQESSNGNVEIESSKVEYGDTAKFTISADDGYTIDQVTVNDTDVSGLVKPVADADSAVYTLTLENVVENKKIAVSFKENEPVSDFTWNRDDALRVSKDQTTYLFAGNADVTFSSIYNSDSIVVHTGSGENMKRYPEQGKYTYVTFNKDTKPDAPVTGIYVGKLHTLNGVQYYSYHKAAADSASINYYFLFDDDAPTITSEVKGTNMNDIYTSDISVKLTVADTDSEGLKSGIGTIRYTLSKDGKTDKEETIYSYTADDSISETVEKEIVIPAKDYNSDEVVLKVEATDRAGNPAEVYEATFNINSTHPVIEVSADDSIDPSAEEGYYKKSRTIQLVYHDRDSSFDQDAAFGGIKIAAADKNGEQVQINKNSMITWMDDTQADVHIAEVTFQEEADYEWSVSYKNKADLTADKIDVKGKSVWKFTVDTESPTGQISADTNSWDKLLENMTFGLLTNQQPKVEVKAENLTDNLSGIHSVLYYKTGTDKVLTLKELEELYQSDLDRKGKEGYEPNFTDEPYAVTHDEEFVIYARLTDKAGNAVYISTTGIIYDTTGAKEQIVITLPEAPVQNDRKVFNNDVKITFNVTEQTSNEQVYSGIKKISYTISSQNPKKEKTEVLVDNNFGDLEPEKKDLLKDYSEDVTVDKNEFDSDEVTFTVNVTDNAGNEYSNSEVFAINPGKPTVSVKFDEAKSQEVDGKYYFSEPRIATITFNDRGFTFDKEKALECIEIKSTDVNGTEIDTTPKISEFTHNGNDHTITVEFDDDANYSWSVKPYINVAGSVSSEVIVDRDTISPFEFTVDRTAPSTGDGNCAITVEENTWSKLLEVLTFGIFKNDTIQVSITGKDKISPVNIACYVVDTKDKIDGLLKSEDDLKKLDDSEWTLYENSDLQRDGLSKENKYVVYAKITDYAGNSTYISSDGFIVDKTPSEITIHPLDREGNEIPKSDNSVYVYNSDYKDGINVKVTVSDPEPSSGVNKIVCRTYLQSSPEKEIQREEYSADQLDDDFLTFRIDPFVSNFSDLVLEVTAQDRAENSNTEICKLDVDTTPPEVAISYKGEQNAGAEPGYYTSRKASVSITERTNHFNEAKATESISITAKNYDGNELTDDKYYTISEWQHEENTDTDKSVHTATIEFVEDANYEFGIDYSDTAGNKSTEPVTGGDLNLYQFTIDNNSPGGKLYIGEKNVWNELVGILTFGVWNNETVDFKASCNDDTSPVKSIELYKQSDYNASAVNSMLSETELEELYKQNQFIKVDLVDKYEKDEEFQIEELKFESDELFTVYARITDYAGNVKYISTAGAVVDSTDSIIDIKPEKANENGYYNEDVSVEITVKDKITENAEESFSGISRVSYEVFCDGKLTQSDILYSFDYDKEDEKLPAKEMLKDKIEENITVEVGEKTNNSDNVEVKVTAVDNAGRVSTATEPLKINATPPTAKLTYNNTAVNKIVDRRGYYHADRTASLVITDRATTFDEDKAQAGINIEKWDASGKKTEVTDSEKNKMISWTHKGDKHTAVIQFNTDANYSWSFAYENKAGLKVQKVASDDSTPFSFTVDKGKPTGEIVSEGGRWNEVIEKVLNVLTFGIYSSKTISVDLSGDDTISPVTVAYYIDNGQSTLKAKQLDDKKFTNGSKVNIDPNRKATVYLKVTDYAGNYIYIRSDGHIVDNAKPKIKLSVVDPNKNGLYNSDVKVSYTVTEPNYSAGKEAYSGIKSIEYWVYKDGRSNVTQHGSKSFDKESPQYNELQSTYTDSIKVSAAKNNSCDVEVRVKATDHAGNTYEKSIKLDIDKTAPSVRIRYNDTKNDGAKSGYFTSRTATITITERSKHFDPNKVIINIKAVDASGKTVNTKIKTKGLSWKSEKGSVPDQDVHTAVIKFTQDGNYTFAIKCTDESGNVNSKPDVKGQTAPYQFTVDKTKPTGSVTVKSYEGKTQTTKQLIRTLSFGLESKGLVSNRSFDLSGSSNDATSPVASVEYYLQEAEKSGDITEMLTKSELDDITNWKAFLKFKVQNDKQFIVYLKITDKAGNVAYVSTYGLIIDAKLPIIESVNPEITVTPPQPVNGIYKGDVKVSVKVEDPVVNRVSSGLKQIRYEIYDRASSKPNVPTEQGQLYQFSGSNPKKAKTSWSGSITVHSKYNNSNRIQVVVYAVDNALNKADNAQKGSKGYTVLKIDTTAPVINISYDNNKAENSKYFKAARTATITVTERNFDAKDVKVSITNADGSVPTVTGWKSTAGSLNGDDAAHTANIVYSADGHYTFSVSYTDKAGNQCKQIAYASGTVASTDFVIDKVKPVINVTYDNKSAKNSDYYKAERTATVVITDHNFAADSNHIKINITATIDGEPVSVPSAGKWDKSGDRYTAKINYVNDAFYTFNISVTDLAGNVSDQFAQHRFYIDTKKPDIDISIKNNSANKEEVAPVIKYSDVNFDSEEVSITLDGANRNHVDISKMGKYSDIANGQTFVFDDFEHTKEVDDIYTLTVTLTDKAGNTRTETRRFSVNRFGSTFELDSAAREINGQWIKEPVDVVIHEINADELTSRKLVLYVNNSPLTLKEGTDYKLDASGGDGEWYQYTYTVFASNFEKDDAYRLELATEDRAGNRAVSTTNEKNTKVSFVVDKTEPEIKYQNIEDNFTYAQENMTVQMRISELNLSKVTVYLDEELIKTWDGESLDEIIQGDQLFEFDVPGTSTSAHTIRTIAYDKAGHKKTTEVNNFYVTTNIWVRYFNNKPLFFGTTGGAAGIIALIIFIIVSSKRKKSKAAS